MTKEFKIIIDGVTHEYIKDFDEVNICEKCALEKYCDRINETLCGFCSRLFDLNGGHFIIKTD